PRDLGGSKRPEREPRLHPSPERLRDALCASAHHRSAHQAGGSSAKASAHRPSRLHRAFNGTASSFWREASRAVRRSDQSPEHARSEASGETALGLPGLYAPAQTAARSDLGGTLAPQKQIGRAELKEPSTSRRVASYSALCLALRSIGCGAARPARHLAARSSI